MKQLVAWPNGKASGYEPEDCGFDPHRDLFFLLSYRNHLSPSVRRHVLLCRMFFLPKKNPLLLTYDDAVLCLGSMVLATLSAPRISSAMFCCRGPGMASSQYHSIISAWPSLGGEEGHRQEIVKYHHPHRQVSRQPCRWK